MGIVVRPRPMLTRIGFDQALEALVIAELLALQGYEIAFEAVPADYPGNDITSFDGIDFVVPEGLAPEALRQLIIQLDCQAILRSDAFQDLSVGSVSDMRAAYRGDYSQLHLLAEQAAVEWDERGDFSGPLCRQCEEEAEIFFGNLAAAVRQRLQR